MFDDVGLLALVPERWGGMWLSRHQMLTRLSRYFHVVWYDPPVGWRKLWSPNGLVMNNADNAPAGVANFTVSRQSRMLPKFYRPAALGRWTARRRLSNAARALEKTGCQRKVLSLWLPRFATALDNVTYDLSTYHIADEYSFSPVEQPLSDAERRIIERVGQVFIHSPALMEKKGRVNPNTTQISNGVDYDAFAAPHPEPVDMCDIPHPRIAYVGRMKVQMDWALLLSLAREHGNWSFVFVGPTGAMGDEGNKRDALFAMPNVYYLGNKSVTDVPAYVNHMDACMLCYVRNAYTRYIYPLKLHEYLAAGKPVVSADIESVRGFVPAVSIAHTPEDWSRLLDETVRAEAAAPERVAERQTIAREHNWNNIVLKMARCIADRLGPEYAARLGATTE